MKTHILPESFNLKLSMRWLAQEVKELQDALTVPLALDEACDALALAHHVERLNYLKEYPKRYSSVVIVRLEIIKKLISLCDPTPMDGDFRRSLANRTTIAWCDKQTSRGRVVTPSCRAVLNAELCSILKIWKGPVIPLTLKSSAEDGGGQ